MAISGFTVSMILAASFGVMWPFHGLPAGLITEMISSRTPLYSSAMPSKYSVSAVYPMVPISGISNLNPTVSGSVCLVFVVAILVLAMLKFTPGFSVIASFIMFWWYVEIAGPVAPFPASMLDGAAMIPLFLVIPRVIASTMISALL